VDAVPLPGERRAPRADEAGAVDAYGDPLPAGAIARLGTRRLVHYKDQCPPQREPRAVFSPDGRTLVVPAEDGAEVWDVRTGRRLDWFQSKAPVRAAWFSPDGRTLLTATGTGSVRHWQVRTGKLLRATSAVPAYRDSNMSAWFFSADGKTEGVATVSSAGGEVHLWDVATGKETFRRSEPDALTLNAALSPDGKLVAITGKGPRAHLFDTATGREVAELVNPNRVPARRPDLVGSLESVNGFAFSPDGRLMAARAGWKALAVWEVATGKVRYHIPAGTYSSLPAFSPDDKYLACNGWYEIRIYEAADGREVRRIRHPFGDQDLSLSPDGKLLASVGGSRVDLWDVATGKRRPWLPGHSSAVTALAFAPDGKALASSGWRDGTVIVWDLSTRMPRRLLATKSTGVWCVAFSPDGRLLAAGDGDEPVGGGGREAHIRVWDWARGRLLWHVPAHLDCVHSVSFSPGGRKLASAGTDSRYRLWDVATGRRLRVFRANEYMAGWAWFSPDGKDLLTAGMRGALTLRRPDDGRKMRDLAPARGGVIRDLYWAGFVGNGSTVATWEMERQLGAGGRDRTELRFWDRAGGGLLRSFDVPPHLWWNIGRALSPDGKTWAMAVGNPPSLAIQLWDTAMGKPLLRLGEDSEHLWAALAFSPDGRTLAAGSRDGTVVLYDLARARLSGLLDQLGGEPDTAARALAELAADPETAVPLLAGRLERAAAQEAVYAPLIAQLDDRRFTVREKASQRVEKAGAAAEFALRLALDANPSPEITRRVRRALDKIAAAREEQAEKLIADLDGRQPQEALRQLKALGADAERVLQRELDRQRMRVPGKPPVMVSPRKRWLVQQALGQAKEPDVDQPAVRVRAVLRCLRVLERIGNPSARAALGDLARGPADGRIASEARAILKRQPAKSAGRSVP
jgi:WD40 repeat protein